MSPASSSSYHNKYNTKPRLVPDISKENIILPVKKKSSLFFGTGAQLLKNDYQEDESPGRFTPRPELRGSLFLQPPKPGIFSSPSPNTESKPSTMPQETDDASPSAAQETEHKSSFSGVSDKAKSLFGGGYVPSKLFGDTSSESSQFARPQSPIPSGISITEATQRAVAEAVKKVQADSLQREEQNETRIEELTKDLAAKDADIREMQASMKKLNSAYENMKKDESAVEKLREMNKILVKEVQEARKAREAEKEAKEEEKRANEDLLNLLDEGDRQREALQQKVDSMAAEVAKMAEIKTKLQQGGNGAMDYQKVAATLHDVNRMIDGPVLAALTGQPAAVSSTSLKQELGGLSLGAPSGQDKDEASAKSEDQPAPIKPAPRNLTFSEVETLKSVEPTFRKLAVIPEAEEENNDSTPKASLRHRTVQIETHEMGVQTEPEPKKVFGADFAEPVKLSYRDHGAGLLDKISMLGLLVFGLMLLYVLGMSMALLSMKERNIWSAANQDTVGLAWISRDSSSWWATAFMAMAGKEMSDIPANLLG